MEEIAKDILIRASQGDIQAFENVYKASSGFVYNVALRVVNNREDALEVAQEVFMIIHRKLKGFRFESSFKTWVYRITANSAINFAKKSSRVKTVPYEDSFTCPAAGGGEGALFNEAETRMDQEHQSQLVENLLAKLNPDQRACVVLRDIQGLSYGEIAQALNININTVRSRLKRSREKLLSLKKLVEYMKKCDYFKDLILTDYIDGELDKNSVGNLESHLLDCSDCRVFFKEVKDNAALPFQQALRQPAPVQLWDTIKQSIEHENQAKSPLADCIAQFKGWVFAPRMVPVFASLILMFLAGSVTLNTIQIQQAREKDQGEYLVALLSLRDSSAPSENNDLGTPIEHYFL